MTDLQLETAARHRVGGRFPSLACLQAEVPLVRASQAVTQRRSPEDERLMATVLGGRKRGFILEIVSKSGPERGESEYGYVGWRRVLTRLPSLQELRDSLQGLATACADVSSDKWLSRLGSSRWLTHVRDVLNAACLTAQCLVKEKAAVLLTENTGTDLSLVISSLAQIIINPDTRTLHGLQERRDISENLNSNVCV